MDIVSRAQWGARKPRAVTLLPFSAIDGLAVHYTAAEADRVDDPNDCPARVRGIQRYHMDTNGWADIAYSWLVCRHGTIYEGRGWNVRTAANGTNAGNDHYLAVCFLGGDRDGRDDVTDPGRQAIAWLWAEIRRRYQTATRIRPHSYFKATACPGAELRRWLTAGMPLPPPIPDRKVTPMYSPPLGPFAAAWLDDHGRVISAVTPDGRVYWGKWWGNVAGKPYWGNRVAADIGARPDGQDGYRITATSGELYDLPDGYDQL